MISGAKITANTCYDTLTVLGMIKCQIHTAHISIYVSEVFQSAQMKVQLYVIRVVLHTIYDNQFLGLNKI